MDLPDGFPAALTEPATLQNVLRRSGALGAGSISGVTVTGSRPQILSRITSLAITYEGEPGPATLIVKSGIPELDARGFMGGAHEVAFYSHVAPGWPPGLVPRCHDAKWVVAGNSWSVLLDDLAASHTIATSWPLPPDAATCEAIVRALARVHAHGWGDARLGDGIGALPGEDMAGQSPDRFAATSAKLVEELGDALAPAHRDLLQKLAHGGHALAARRASNALTVVHGDAHMWNVFLPREGIGGGPLWFDWDSWRVDLGANDLAYMLAMHWYPDLRRQRESRLLDAYHAALGENGVTHYARARLDEDYRLCVLLHLAAPVNQWSIGVPAVIWWNNLQRLLLAVDDLGCRELLG